MCMYAPPPKERANLQLMIQWDAESQSAAIQGEEKWLPSPTCDCAECKDDRQELRGVRQEQRREECEADVDEARSRRIRIYRWRKKHKFPLFYRSQEEREYLKAKRAERRQKQ